MNKKHIFLVVIILVLALGCSKENYEDDSLFFYSNSFTPNGDGLNDSWGPTGGSVIDTTYPGNCRPTVNLGTFYLKITNKKNKPLFITASVNNRWDGTYKGDTCPVDFYYYLATYESFEGKKYKDVGMIEIIF